MRVTQIGVNRCYDEHYIKDFPGETVHYLLLLIKSKTRFKINEEWICADPNTIIIYNLGTPQYFCADSEIFIHDWLTYVPEEEETGFFAQLGIAMDTIYQLHEVTYFTELFKAINTEFLANNECKNQSISAYLHLFFYKLAEYIHRTESGANDYHEQLQRIRAMIYDNPAKRWSVQELSAKISISASYFQSLYKNRFDITPIADVINSRIEYAKYLLTSTDYSISRISKELNYSCDISFIQQFKSMTRITPFQYRVQMLNGGSNPDVSHSSEQNK